MKKSMFLTLISIYLFTIISCSKQEEVMVEEDTINPIRIEIEQVIVERDILEIWGLSIDVCSSLSSFDGTKDFEFMEEFIRIDDKYFQYDRLVSFEVDTRANGNQMLLCFN